MKQRLKFMMYVAGVALLFNSCKKTDPLPKPTQEGLNTFGCKINGEVWIPTGTSGPGGTKPTLAVLKQDGTFRISANSPQQLFDMNIPKVGSIKIGEYILGTTSDSFGYFNDGSTSFLTDRTHLGKVTITFFDSNKQIISGTFQFQAKDRNSEKVIEISDGRFDITY